MTMPRLSRSGSALLFVLLILLLSGVSAYTLASGKPYAPGETLDPSCGPEDPSCFVLIPPPVATTTLGLPSIFSVTGSPALVGNEAVHITLAPQGANQFFAGPLHGGGEPGFRLISDQDLPNPLHKDIVGTVYGNLIGTNVFAQVATTTHLYASAGHFETLTVGGRVIGADEFIASTLCGIPQDIQPAITDELDFPQEPAILIPPIEDRPIIEDDSGPAVSLEPPAPEQFAPDESPTSADPNQPEPNETVP